ncbi:MAG: hypothetical protein SGJ18_16435 [Pseudomonadota bacterium]|nr:hypothetical protein [Pseudomonadota bacterium]
MTAVDFLSELRKIQIPLFQTKEIADLLGISTDRASKYLETLRGKDFLEKVGQGKWVMRDVSFDPLQVAEFLTAPKESYISLHSALFFHGMIEQIPTQTYSVTLARSKVLRSSVGAFSFHHCHISFFTGYEYLKPYLKLATPEKALVDYFYFAPSKSRQFTQLPELEIPKKFSWKKAYVFCDKITSLRTKGLVLAKLKTIERR